MANVIKYLLLGTLVCGCSCGNSGKDNPQPAPVPEPDPTTSRDIAIYTTSADRSHLFSESYAEFGKAGSMSPYVVRFTDETYQAIDGFGAAITVSSCYNLLKMPQAKRTAFLKKVFDPVEGMGSSLVRVCIGGSDFSWDYGEAGISSDGRFTWCDKEGIGNFAPHPMDVKYVIPVLKEIYSINKEVKVIGSPWTAPRWMKTDAKLSGDAHYSWTGGRLAPEHYQDYATYFVKWIQYMQGQGFDVYAVTPQNEPLNAGNSMSMLMYWEDCRDFVKVLGPAIRDAGLGTKVLVFDHNYNYDSMSGQDGYPLKVYADPDASQWVAGSAWHNYGGDVSELERIAKEAPGKEIYFTEASIGSWNYSFAACLVNDFKSIFLGTLSRGCRGVTLWNLVLDDKNGPYTNAGGSCTTCYGAVTVSSSDHASIEPYTHYYNIAHCSKVIRPGAVRIGTGGFTTPGLEYLAFRNTDGSLGVVVLNGNSADQQLVFATASHSVKCTVPAKAIVSLLWKD